MSRHGSCAECTVAAKLRSIPKHLVGTGDEDFHLEVARRPKRHVLLVGTPHRLRLTDCGLQENKMPLCVIFPLKLVSNESWCLSSHLSSSICTKNENTNKEKSENLERNESISNVWEHKLRVFGY
jgi:hypothetical protein